MDVPQYDCLDLVDPAHEQSSQAMIAHMSVGPLGGEAASVDRLTLLARHTLAPGDGTGTVRNLVWEAIVAPKESDYGD